MSINESTSKEILATFKFKQMKFEVVKTDDSHLNWILVEHVKSIIKLQKNLLNLMFDKTS